MATNEELIQRIQAQLSASARQNFTPIAVPPFTIYINEETDEPWSNYAIPDATVTATFEEATAQTIDRRLTALCAAFRAQGRQPRLEYVHEFIPALAPVLQAHGFEEEMNTQLMLCTPESYAAARAAQQQHDDATLLATPHITLRSLQSQDPIEHFQAYMTVQRRAFGHGNADPVDVATAEQFRRRFATSQFIAAWATKPPNAPDVNRQPAMVSVVTLLPAHDGITELAGIGTAAPYRRQGIASALTAHAAEHAFAQGLWGLFLTAANAEAGRVYERVGFRPIGTGLAYRLPIAVESVCRDDNGAEPEL